MSDSMFDALVSKAEDLLANLFKTSEAYRQASGNQTVKDLDAFIDSATDPEVVAKRDRIAKALAVVKEHQAELREWAKNELMPDGVNADELATKFKADKQEAKKFLHGSIQALEGLGAPTEVIEQIKQYQEQLPNVSGSTAAGLSSSGKSPEELKAAREWLRANGHEVADKGRIAKELLELWDKRHEADAA